jgi:hypothetical protein
MENVITFVLIPSDSSKPLTNLNINVSENSTTSITSEQNANMDKIHSYLSKNINAEGLELKVTPLKRMESIPSFTDYNQGFDYDTFVNAAGVYVYSFVSQNVTDKETSIPNVRATSLSMACGLHSLRFHGDVYISRLGYYHEHTLGYNILMNFSFTTDEILSACCISPDIRLCILEEMSSNTEIKNTQLAHLDVITPISSWLADASRVNYQDAGSLSTLASVMKQAKEPQIGSELSDIKEEEELNEGEDFVEEDVLAKFENKSTKDIQSMANTSHHRVIRQTLCLHCRRPSNSLCIDCGGAYFCEQSQICSLNGWSHQCLCPTWALYTRRREELSTFPFDSWHHALIGRNCQLSDEPYTEYLTNVLKVLPSNKNSAAGSSFWDTEVDGWCGGQSSSAKLVDATIRRTYQNGFKLDEELIPTECHITDDDLVRCSIEHDECNLPRLRSWDDYYLLRKIPLSSPVALLLTFPLTIYHAIQKYGAVPVTVSRMLKRQLRIHVVGIEKEMNFLDLFKEIGYILPFDVKVELVFIVREDMLPPSYSKSEQGNDRYDLQINLTSNVSLLVKSGTYGGSIDPNFDCGSGPPDMLIGMNAGLFAYESWRDVIEYLNENNGVVGVFTDYNEHSGTNCASLGGGKSRESLNVNPFRQPRAMPVYSMNLPQFSNGFMYVFNEQELDL